MLIVPWQMHISVCHGWVNLNTVDLIPLTFSIYILPTALASQKPRVCLVQRRPFQHRRQRRRRPRW
jgi:hypothetical protein